MQTHTRDEAGLFVASRDSPVLYAIFRFKQSIARYGYVSTVHEVFGDRAGQVLALYPAPADPDDRDAEERVIIALTTDFFFTCPTLAVLDGVDTTLGQADSVFMYQFTQVPHFLPIFGGKCMKDYACHAMDLPYLWRPDFLYMSPKERALSDEMIRYFRDFMNGRMDDAVLTRHRVAWPSYHTGQGEYLELGDEIRPRRRLREPFCQLWNEQLGYDW